MQDTRFHGNVFYQKFHVFLHAKRDSTNLYLPVPCPVKIQASREIPSICHSAAVEPSAASIEIEIHFRRSRGYIPVEPRKPESA